MTRIAAALVAHVVPPLAALLLGAGPAFAAVAPPPDVKVEMMGVDFALPMHAAKSAVFIDVRGDAAFNAEHIEGAMAFSLEDLRAGKLPRLPKTMPLVVYCGCPHSLSEESARYLIAGGFQRVWVLDEGYFGWKDKGYPVTVNETEAARKVQMTVTGAAPGLAPGTRVYARHAASGQWEAGKLDAAGAFELHLPFYGVMKGEEIQILAGDRKQAIPFDPAGARVELR